MVAAGKGHGHIILQIGFGRLGQRATPDFGKQRAGFLSAFSLQAAAHDTQAAAGRKQMVRHIIGQHQLRITAYECSADAAGVERKITQHAAPRQIHDPVVNLQAAAQRFRQGRKQLFLRRGKGRTFTLPPQYDRCTSLLTIGDGQERDMRTAKGREAVHAAVRFQRCGGEERLNLRCHRVI